MIKVLKKNLNHVTCITGKLYERYFAIASIKGRINQAERFIISPLIGENILMI